MNRKRKVALTCQIDLELYEKIQKLREDNFLNVSAFVAAAIKEKLLSFALI
jgi:post-segregation antitoxin (ccd killing protein)